MKDSVMRERGEGREVERELRMPSHNAAGSGKVWLMLRHPLLHVLGQVIPSACYVLEAM